MIDLYASGSPNVFKVLLMLSETDLPYTLHEVNVAGGQQFRPEFIALNPNSKIPAMVDQDGPRGAPHTVFESGAILIYLAEKTGRLLSKDPVERSVTLQWLMWQMASVGPMFGQALHFTFIAPPGNEYAKTRYRTEVNRLYDVIENRLAQSRWLAGDEYSIADIATFPWVGKYVKTLEIDIETRPHVKSWIAAVEDRPAHRRIEALGKDLFKRGLILQKEASPADLDRFFGRQQRG